jgi:glycerophosphoryl diester phosphodiesterase
LAALDAGFRFTTDGGRSYPYRGRGIGLPRFRDVLAAFPETPLLIEVKAPAASQPLRALIESSGAASRCIVAAFFAIAMPPFAGSAIARGSSQRDLIALLPRAILRRPASTLPYEIIAMPSSHRGIPLPMRGYVRAAAGANVPIHVWTVNDTREADRLWAAGVCGLISDDPGSLLAHRRSRGDR